MKGLSLNIRGFGGDAKVKKLRELLSKEKVGFLAVHETLLLADTTFLTSLFWKHSYWSFCQIPSTSRSGGAYGYGILAFSQLIMSSLDQDFLMLRVFGKAAP